MVESKEEATERIKDIYYENYAGIEPLTDLLEGIEIRGLNINDVTKVYGELYSYIEDDKTVRFPYENIKKGNFDIDDAYKLYKYRR
jgi:hypothetical protein